MNRQLTKKQQVSIFLSGIVLFALTLNGLDLSLQAAHWLTNLSWMLASLAAAIRCQISSRKLRRPIRRAWQLFALGCFCYFTGRLCQELELFFNQRTAFSTLSNTGFFLLPVFFIAGLFILKREKIKPPPLLYNN